MKNTNLLLLLSAALIVSSADVSAMNIDIENITGNKRKRESDAKDDGHLNKKVKTGLSQADQDELDWLEERAYFSEEEEAAYWGLKTKRVALLEEQNKSVAEMIKKIENLSGNLGFAETLEEAINSVTDIMVMWNQCDVDFSGEQDLCPLVVGDDNFLKLQLARKIVEIREKAEALVVIVNDNRKLTISDVSSEGKKEALKELHGLLNKILVKVGCQAIEVQIVMNTEEDGNIAQQEYDQEKSMMAQEDEDFASREHLKYLQAKSKREEDDAKIAHDLELELNNSQQQAVVHNNDQGDGDIQAAIAASLKDDAKQNIDFFPPEQAIDDANYQEIQAAIAASLKKEEAPIVIRQPKQKEVIKDNDKAKKEKKKKKKNKKKDDKKDDSSCIIS